MLYDSDDSDDAHVASWDPRQFIPFEILTQLAHLGLSDRVVLSDARVYKAGTFGDVLKARCPIDGRGMVRVAIKRLRFYMNEDIKMVRILHL